MGDRSAEITPKESAEYIAELSKRLVQNVEKVIAGKRQAIQTALVALFSEGHTLVEDAPGVAKTVLVKSLARSIGGSFRRVQCTPDLLPSDITGISIYNQKSQEFEFRPGPAFANLLLTDELNRATPRTQSALLECMAENQITIDGITHRMASPFLVFATQNPIEFEGTFPLPEAQLDRFCIRMRIGYPAENDELAILERFRLSHPMDTLEAVASPEEIVQAQQMIRHIYVHDEIRSYIIRIVRATRGHQEIAIGGSPRASMALFRTSQAVAAMNGIEYVLPEFVKAMAPLVLEHRIVMKPEARLRGRSAEAVIGEVLDGVPAPVPKKGS